MNDYQITQAGTEDVGGYTRVRAKFSCGTLALQVPGAAEVTTTAYGFKILATGASVRTAHHVFRYKFEEGISQTSQHDVIGVVVLKKDLKEPLLRLQPRLGSAFVVAIGPSDVLISNDDGEALSQAFRAPLDMIAAITLEMLLRPPPAELPLFSAATMTPPQQLLTSA